MCSSSRLKEDGDDDVMMMKYMITILICFCVSCLLLFVVWRVNDDESKGR